MGVRTTIMTGVEIHDRAGAGFLAFDLRDILQALGPRILPLLWRCSNIESTGDGAERLHRVADEGTWVDGTTLHEIAESVMQVIDGEFFGHRGADSPPEIIIWAIDSTLWMVFGDADALERIRRRFSDVRPGQYPFY
jgi:hypothetical protein